MENAKDYDWVYLHERAGQATRDVVAAIRDDQLSSPTPCAEWDVRAVLNHLVGENWWVPELAQGKTIEEVGDQLEGDMLRDNPLLAWDSSFAAAQAAFAGAGAMERSFHLGYGDVPGAVYASQRVLDILIHGWDLARGTGQDDTLDPDLVEAVYESFQPQEDLIEISDLFDPVIPVPDDADPQTKLLALLGRER